MKKQYAIQSEVLKKYYGRNLALDDINLKISYGKTFGLLGPNGAGKTTLIRILTCIIPPSSGSAQVAGYDVVKQPNEVKANCGLLPETPGLYQKLTAQEFLKFIGDLYYIPKDILQDRIDELLEIFELQNRKSDLLENYSKGMKQKISICCALIHDPKILFFDEPTSNLDPSSARIVKDLISEMVKKADKTVFLSSHLLDVAEELCDYICMINKGEIKIQGTLDEIIEKSKTKDLEEAYIKIIGKSNIENYLSWRMLK